MEEFTHTIKAYVRPGPEGSRTVRFSTYLSFLQLTCTVRMPEPNETTTIVHVSFSLKKPDENKDGSKRKSTKQASE